MQRSPSVGAVYDRALFPEFSEIRAVIDRAYSRNPGFCKSLCLLNVRDERGFGHIPKELDSVVNYGLGNAAHHVALREIRKLAYLDHIRNDT